MAYGSTDSLEILAQDFLERKCSRTFADQNHSLEISTAAATPVLPVAGLRVWNVTSCFPQTPEDISTDVAISIAHHPCSARALTLVISDKL